MVVAMMATCPRTRFSWPLDCTNRASGLACGGEFTAWVGSIRMLIAAVVAGLMLCSHIPWVMPQRFLDQQVPLQNVDVAKRDVPPENYCNASLYICDNVYSGLPWEPATKADQQDHRRKYRAAVSFTDFNVGRILQTVDAEGFSNDTAIIFNGDQYVPTPRLVQTV